MITELNKGEQLKHDHNDRKAKARHHEIVQALNFFTVFAMELLAREELTEKARGRIIYHVGRLRRDVIVNSHGNVGQCLHTGNVIENLQLAVKHLKTK